MAILPIPVNIGVGKDIIIKNLAEMIEEVIGFEEDRQLIPPALFELKKRDRIPLLKQSASANPRAIRGMRWWGKGKVGDFHTPAKDRPVATTLSRPDPPIFTSLHVPH